MVKVTRKKKKITEKTILRRAVKRGAADDTLFYLWLEHSDKPQHQQLHRVWSDPNLIYEETRKDKPQYGIDLWEKLHDEFQTLVIQAILEKKKKKKKNKKKSKEKEEAKQSAQQ